LDASALAAGFITIAGAIFIAELTDKDALMLLSLATRMKPLLVFAAGSVAFTITSAVIVLVGSALITYVPIEVVKVAGGMIMLGYAALVYFRGSRGDGGLEQREARLLNNLGRTELYAFLTIIASLIVLDLAGDATELLTIVFVAQFRNLLLVFVGAVVALVAASAVETALGNRLGKILSAMSLRRFSAVVFLIIGLVVILSSGILPV
jgi:putative Ca2+/H+ antiporter (TMEM165/GDT1 family)